MSFANDGSPWVTINIYLIQSKDEFKHRELKEKIDEYNLEINMLKQDISDKKQEASSLKVYCYIIIINSSNFPD